MIDLQPGVLYSVATPIGNLEDMTFRAVRILREADVIAAEDTRVTSKLLSHYEIDTPMVSYREQNAARQVPHLVKMIQGGKSVALVTDAGTPSISDPGQELVRAAYEHGISVVPIPGTSAFGAAVSVSALDGEGMRFLGFLPRKGKNRKMRLEAIANDPSCTVVYESPHRLAATLVDLQAHCGDRMAIVGREMTKRNEEIARAPLSLLAERFNGPVKGEVTIIVEGSKTTYSEVLDDGQLRELVMEHLAQNKSAKDIAGYLSSALGIRKKKIYQMAVSLARSPEKNE